MSPAALPDGTLPFEDFSGFIGNSQIFPLTKKWRRMSGK
jgi:hypothetical protein